MKTYQPVDWKELQSILFDEKNTKIDRFRSDYVYRGVANSKYGLETSIQRIGIRPSEIEKHLIRNFKKYSPINTLIDNYNNIWNWIALGQHHGLPTRLLDWTFSPNVALHFMCEDTSLSSLQEEGAIWRVNFVKMKELMTETLKKYLTNNNILIFGSKELEEVIGKEYDDLISFSKKEANSIIFFEPPSIDDRIINQFALFSFMLDPDSSKIDFLKNTDLFDKILINPNLKWEIRDKLDQANITERIIYPGLDGISKWLKRWYSEKNTLNSWRLK